MNESPRRRFRGLRQLTTLAATGALLVSGAAIAQAQDFPPVDGSGYAQIYDANLAAELVRTDEGAAPAAAASAEAPTPSPKSVEFSQVEAGVGVVAPLLAGLLALLSGAGFMARRIHNKRS